MVYRARNGFAPDEVRLAVVVQRMVVAEVSGVLFTVDPVTQHRATMLIDAVRGLGEALVGGRITPDVFRVDRRRMWVLERATAVPADGTPEPILDDDRVLELARLGGAVEAHFGTPQDIEWAVADGLVHVLQSRPITSLYPIDALRSPDGSLHVHFSVGHQQSMTRAMTPLGRSTVLALVPGGDHDPTAEHAVLHVAGGRLFADVTQVLRHPVGRRALMGMLSQLDALAPDAVRVAMARPEFRHRPRPRLSFARVRGLLAVAGRVAATVGWRDLTGFRLAAEARMDAFEAEARGRIGSAPLGRERGEVSLEVARSVFPFLLTFVPLVAAGVIATRLLTRLAGRWLDADELEALTLAVPGNVVNEMNLAIDDLAEKARRSPELVARFDAVGEDARAWLAAAAGVDGGRAFLAAFAAFLERFGARGAAEIDLSMPRFRDEPMPVLKVIAASLRNEGPTYRERVAGYEAERAAAFERLVAAARRGFAGPLRVRALRRLYRTMVEVGGMREHHKFLAVRVLALIREGVVDLAERLVARGSLGTVDDVWYLTWPELSAAWGAAHDDLRARIASRRAAHARDQRLSPPLIVTSDGEIPSVRYRHEGAHDGALLGNPVSPGVIEGPAHVVTDPARDELAPGEVLVAEFTDPGWTPLFINASGLVLEVGGALTHGAVVAREYGIPAVVGVRGATAAIRTGQRVGVDGDRGIVEVLDGG
ncbi:MAG: PEP/pyruvate-binding domain-containing protein [Trueperaceae bacterium]|nr:PEP/pyruvate-binding domain-containing protein [Trueperaceae bacterium]